MRQIDGRTDSVCDSCGSPLSPQFEKQSDLFELRTQSRLFGDLGKHLSMLSQLVEQELSSLPSPPGSCGSLGYTVPANARAPRPCGRPIPKAAPKLSSILRQTRSASVELGSVLKAAEAFAFKHSVTHVGAVGANVTPSRNEVRVPGFVPAPLPSIEADDNHRGPPSLEGARAKSPIYCDESQESTSLEDSEVFSDRAQLVRAATRFDVLPPSHPPCMLPTIPGYNDDDDGNASSTSKERSTRVVVEEPSAFTHESTILAFAKIPSAGSTSRMVEFLQGLQHSRGETNEESSTIHARLRSALAGGKFEAVLVCAILVNAILIGFQTQERMRINERSSWYRAVDVAFTLFFFVELCLRLYVDGLSHFSFTNPNCKFNVLDTVIIATSTFDEFLHFSGIYDALVHISLLRALRIFRISRIIRTVRLMRYFRDLRVMILGICASFKSLFGAISLLTLLVYITSILIVDALSSSTAALESEAVMERYGSVIMTIYTLFLSIFGGIDWGDAAAPLFETSVFLGLAFMFYVIFSLICVLNVITGVFVETASQMTAKTDEEIIVERLVSRQKYMAEARAMISEMLPSNSVNEDGFADLLSSIKFQAILRKLDVYLDERMSRSLFRAIDFDGEGNICADDLAGRISTLHGQAKSIDCLRVMQSVKKINTKLDGLICGNPLAHADPSHPKMHACIRPSCVGPPMSRLEGPNTATRAKVRFVD